MICTVCDIDSVNSLKLITQPNLHNKCWQSRSNPHHIHSSSPILRGMMPFGRSAPVCLLRVMRVSGAFFAICEYTFLQTTVWLLKLFFRFNFQYYIVTMLCVWLGLGTKSLGYGLETIMFWCQGPWKYSVNSLGIDDSNSAPIYHYTWHTVCIGEEEEKVFTLIYSDTVGKWYTQSNDWELAYLCIIHTFRPSIKNKMPEQVQNMCILYMTCLHPSLPPVFSLNG